MFYIYISCCIRWWCWHFAYPGDHAFIPALVEELMEMIDKWIIFANFDDLVEWHPPLELCCMPVKMAFGSSSKEGGLRSSFMTGSFFMLFLSFMCVRDCTMVHISLSCLYPSKINGWLPRRPLHSTTYPHSIYRHHLSIMYCINAYSFIPEVHCHYTFVGVFEHWFNMFVGALQVIAR